MKKETSTHRRHTDLPRPHLRRPPPPSRLRSAGRDEPLELTGLILSASLHLGPAAGLVPIAALHPFPPRGSDCLRTHLRAPTPVVCHLHPPCISILHPLPSLLHLPFPHCLPHPPCPGPGGQTEAASILWHQPRSSIPGLGGWGVAKVRRGLEFEGNLFCLTSPLSPPSTSEEGSREKYPSSIYIYIFFLYQRSN